MHLLAHQSQADHSEEVRDPLYQRLLTGPTKPGETSAQSMYLIPDHCKFYTSLSLSSEISCKLTESVESHYFVPKMAGLARVDTRGATRLPARVGFFNLKNPGGFFYLF